MTPEQAKELIDILTKVLNGINEAMKITYHFEGTTAHYFASKECKESIDKLNDLKAKIQYL